MPKTLDYHTAKQRLDELRQRKEIDQDTYFFRLYDLRLRKEKAMQGIHYNYLDNNQRQ